MRWPLPTPPMEGWVRCEVRCRTFLRWFMLFGWLGRYCCPFWLLRKLPRSLRVLLQSQAHRKRWIICRRVWRIASYNSNSGDYILFVADSRLIFSVCIKPWKHSSALCCNYIECGAIKWDLSNCAIWISADWDYNGDERIRKRDLHTHQTGNHSPTQLQLKDEEFKRERTLLQQKIELLSSEVAEYQEKQFKNKQLNESIILTYRQNESFRDQLNQREL